MKITTDGLRIHQPLLKRPASSYDRTKAAFAKEAGKAVKDNIVKLLEQKDKEIADLKEQHAQALEEKNKEISKLKDGINDHAEYIQTFVQGHVNILDRHGARRSFHPIRREV